jgi:hypothetical protein
LPDERGAELREVELEAAVEMGGVRLLSRQRRQTIDHQSARTKQIGEQRREIPNRRGEVVRIVLRSSDGGTRQQACGHQSEQSNHESPGWC